MPVKIRLTRQGRKKQAYYHIVIADSRAPRDGRFIENLGNYNPNTNPATIELNFDRALEWLMKGAQPTDTCRAILSYKGVMYKKHLLEGVKKNAFSEEEAEKRFAEWLKQKEEKIRAKRDYVKGLKADLKKKQLEDESKVNEKRAEKIARKNAKLAAKEAEEQEATETVADQEVNESQDVNPSISEETSHEAENADVKKDVSSEEKEAEGTEA